jgi:hypothetical protein
LIFFAFNLSEWKKKRWKHHKFIVFKFEKWQLIGKNRFVGWHCYSLHWRFWYLSIDRWWRTKAIWMNQNRKTYEND